MRHRVAKHHFNRDSNHRKALLKGLVRSLVEHGSIVTTQAKAKETRRIADKLIYRAQQDTVSRRRLIHKFFGKRDIVNTLIERVAPAMKDRKSGFSKLEAVGKRRGDNTALYKLSLMTMPERLGTLRPDSKDIPVRKEVKKSVVKKATKKVAKKAPVKTTVKKTTAKPKAKATTKPKKK